MGKYGATKVLTTVLRVDEYPLPVVMETYDFVDCTNGNVLACVSGPMVVVGHYNAEGWGPDYFHRTIHVVPAGIWHPELSPEPGSDAIIGYYLKISESGDAPPEYVKRGGYADGDSTIEAALRNEGRWPSDVPGVWKS